MTIPPPINPPPTTPPQPEPVTPIYVPEQPSTKKATVIPKTKVVFYHSERAMQKGITKEQLKGWEFVSSEQVEQGWGCFKTCALGCLFLPLALLGKKQKHFKVIYKIAED